MERSHVIPYRTKVWQILPKLHAIQLLLSVLIFFNNYDVLDTHDQPQTMGGSRDCQFLGYK